MKSNTKTIKLLSSVAFLVLAVFLFHQNNQENSASLHPQRSLHVLVSIKPIHSLVAAVGEGVFSPDLLMKGGQSPHLRGLTAQEAQEITQADLVIWIGKMYEAVIADSIGRLASDSSTVITLSSLKGLKLYPNRPLTLTSKGSSVHNHNNHHDIDGHLWLDPDNAVLCVQEIVRVLKKKDPSHSQTYEENGKKLELKIRNLGETLRKKLSSFSGKPYVLYHDSMQYFDRYFGTQAIAAVVKEPGDSPSSRHLLALKKIFKEDDIQVLFVEPSFQEGLCASLAKECDLSECTLDYLGEEIPAGPSAYTRIMEKIATHLSKMTTL